MATSANHRDEQASQASKASDSEIKAVQPQACAA